MGKVICGHTTTSFDGGGFTCYLPAGHAGWHEETFRDRDGRVSRTNWGDDGLGIHASRRVIPLGEAAHLGKVAATQEP